MGPSQASPAFWNRSLYSSFSQRSWWWWIIIRKWAWGCPCCPCRGLSLLLPELRIFWWWEGRRQKGPATVGVVEYRGQEHFLWGAVRGKWVTGPEKAIQTPSFLSLVFLFQFPSAFFITWLLDLLGQQFQCDWQVWGARAKASPSDHGLLSLHCDFKSCSREVAVWKFICFSFLRFCPLSLSHTLECRVVPFSIAFPL